jgi:hypothetical protein
MTEQKPCFTAVINGGKGTDEIIITKRLRGKGETGERENETAAGIFYLYFATCSTFP